MGSTTPPPSPYTPPPPLTMLEFREMMARQHHLLECECALEEAEEAHSKMVEALAAQERAEQWANAEKARASEWQKTALAEIGSAKKSSEESHSVGKKARVAALEQAIFASIRKSNEAQKSSDEANSKMVSDLLAEARRREEKLQENLRLRDKKVDELEQAHSKMVGELGEARRREEKLHEKFESRDKMADELVEGCANLLECWEDSEREVAKVVWEKEGLMEEMEELKAKVEKLSKALEEVLARETSRLEEEYDMVEYEECCKLDDEESDS